MEEEPKRKEFVLLHEELSFAHNWKLSSRVKVSQNVLVLANFDLSHLHVQMWQQLEVERHL